MVAFRHHVLALVFLASAAVPAKAQGEPNDSCITASPLTAGVYTGLQSSDWYEPPFYESTDFDFYRVTLQPGELLEFTCQRTGSQWDPANLWIDVYELSTGCPGTYTEGHLDSAVITRANLGSTPRDYVFRVNAWLAGEGIATIYYTINLVIAPDACPGAVDDAYESDFPVAPTPMGFGTVPNLFARYFDDDRYSLIAPSGTTITVRIDLQHALGDLDLTVYDDQHTVSSTSLSDQEVVTFTSQAIAIYGRVFVRVGPKPGASSVCNHYAMTIDVVAPSLGTSYCSANANSYGVEARILTAGSSSVSANFLWFFCQALPSAAPSLLIAGTAQSQIPFGDGWRCIGGSIVRLQSAVPVHRVATFHSQFASAPWSAITPGTTWNFQAFYRDPSAGGSGFNLTDAVSIPMLP